MKEQKGTKLSAYKLPIKSPERNYPHPEKKTYYSLSELQYGDLSGMTETDSKTSGKEDGQYTSINKKSGKDVKAGEKLGLAVKYDKHTKVG